MLNPPTSFIVLWVFVSLVWSAEISADALWTKAEIRILRSLSLSALPPIPISYSNRYADDPFARKLGEKLFFDSRLSGNRKLSCASCHHPDKYFTDGLSRGVGVSATGRNTPTVVGSAWLRWFYWDGRRDSLWSQALIPFEAPNEMGNSRLAVIRFIVEDAHYRQQYESLFSKFPRQLVTWLSNNQTFRHAGPLGDKKMKDNWYRIPQNVRKYINRVYTNIGKSIEAYERSLVPKETRFDRYVSFLLGDVKAKVDISKRELKGIKLFIDANKTQCLQCHNGPLQTNNDFHNIGTGNFTGNYLDFGRMLGLQAVLMDEFNCMGPYSDADNSQCKALRFLSRNQHIPLKGAFKTPSLRNLTATAPYFHDGRFNRLIDVLHYYQRPPEDNGAHELKALNLKDEELLSLVSFLEMFTEFK